MKYLAPSVWASYLINGDASGIDDADIAACDAWYDSLRGEIVDCEAYGFVWRHDAYAFFPLGADCQAYTVIENESGARLPTSTTS
jgi:hypothetical protein